MGNSRNFVVLTLLIHTSFASNWAQVSGPRAQNVVEMPNINPSKPDIGPRCGHAIVVTGEMLFVFGGEGVGGGFLNDVFSTSGKQYKLITTSGGEQPTVGIKSTAAWASHSRRSVPCTQEDECPHYHDWLACAFRGDRLIKYNWPRQCTVDLQRLGQHLDFYKRWLPRRNHNCVYFSGTKQILCMGGRTKSKNLPGYKNRTKFMNDVWSWRGPHHLEAGDTEWKLENPGCLGAPQRDLVVGSGAARFRCTGNTDCYGDSECDMALGTCVCRMWSAREQFAVAEKGGKIFLSGGFAWADEPFSSDENRSRVVGLQDMWWSTNGERWWRATNVFGARGAPPWAGRGGHAMVLFHSRLWLFGGMADGKYFNDIWSWSESHTNTSGSGQWVASGNATWSPRGNFVAVVKDAINGPIILIGGNDGQYTYGDVWTWRPYSTTTYPWVRDFANDLPDDVKSNTSKSSARRRRTMFPRDDYIHKDMPVSRMRSNVRSGDAIIDKHQVRAFRNEGVVTIMDLAKANDRQLLALREHVPETCRYFATAVAVVKRCTVPNIALPDVVWTTNGERAAADADGNRNSKAARSSVCGATSALKTMSLLGPEDITCIWRPSPRTHAAGATLHGVVYIFGGQEAEAEAGAGKQAKLINDLWYRDPRPPSGWMKTKPMTNTPDTRFEFADFVCCEPSLFEFALLDLGAVGADEGREVDALSCGCENGPEWCEDNECVPARKDRQGLTWRSPGPDAKIDLAGGGTGLFDMTKPLAGSWMFPRWYLLLLKSTDPAGNVDRTFAVGPSSRYSWVYCPGPPSLGEVVAWTLPIGCVLAYCCRWLVRRRQSLPVAPPMDDDASSIEVELSAACTESDEQQQ